MSALGPKIGLWLNHVGPGVRGCAEAEFVAGAPSEHPVGPCQSSADLAQPCRPDFQDRGPPKPGPSGRFDERNQRCMNRGKKKISAEYSTIKGFSGYLLGVD